MRKEYCDLQGYSQERRSTPRTTIYSSETSKRAPKPPPPPRLPVRTRTLRRPLLLARTVGTRQPSPASCLQSDFVSARQAEREQAHTLSLGELHLIHPLGSVPVQESLAPEHARELFVSSLKQLCYGGCLRGFESVESRERHEERAHVSDERACHTHSSGRNAANGGLDGVWDPFCGEMRVSHESQAGDG